MSVFKFLLAELAEIHPIRHFGHVSTLRSATLIIQGLSRHARLGDRVQVQPARGEAIGAESSPSPATGPRFCPNHPSRGWRSETGSNTWAATPSPPMTAGSAG